MNILLVFVGGGIGAVLRYWLSGAVYRVLDPGFPHGTLLVNILGCFAIGLLMAGLEERFAAVPALRVFLAIGILGGFTTFSSFSYETLVLFRDGEMLKALLNIGSNVLFCLAGTFVGQTVGRFI